MANDQLREAHRDIAFCRLRTYCPKVTVTGRGGARVAEHGSPLPQRFSATRQSNCEVNESKACVSG